MRHLLYPLSALFYAIISLRNFLYDKGLLRIKKVNTPVLCVGNITTGGTGKTPWVQFICQYLESKNKKVVIVSRGYGGTYEGILKVETDMDARLCGDEPLWLAKNTQATVYLSKDRYAGAEKAIQEIGPDLIILDDGYQHRRFHRDLNIVLLDASAKNSTYKLLPVGNMREGFSALRRSDAVVINKCNYAEDQQVNRLIHKVEKFKKFDEIWKADFVFQEWKPLFNDFHQSFKNQNISICCGLGNPHAFVKTVRNQNFQPIEMFIFPDHFYWRSIDIEKMTYKMKNRQSFDLMVTEKDAVKLARYKKHFKEMGIQLWVCRMKVKIQEDEHKLYQLIDQLTEKP